MHDRYGDPDAPRGLHGRGVGWRPERSPRRRRPRSRLRGGTAGRRRRLPAAVPVAHLRGRDLEPERRGRARGSILPPVGARPASARARRVPFLEALARHTSGRAACARSSSGSLTRFELRASSRPFSRERAPPPATPITRRLRQPSGRGPPAECHSRQKLQLAAPLVARRPRRGCTSAPDGIGCNVETVDAPGPRRDHRAPDDPHGRPRRHRRRTSAPWMACPRTSPARHAARPRPARTGSSSSSS